MTPQSPGANELRATLAALDRIAELTSDGRGAFDHSADRKLALTFCWVNVGSQLKQFVRKVDLRRGTEPLTPPIKMRDKLAYGPLPGLNTDTVWDTSVHDGPRLREFVAELLAVM